MRNLVFTLFGAALLLISSQTFAVTNNELFSIDEVSIEETFAPLDKLEEIVASHPAADLGFVREHYALELEAVNLLNQANSLTAPLEGDMPVAGISSYIWGACLGLVGVAIVYFLLDDASTAYRKKETTHALVGCAISAVVWTVIYVALIASAASGI